MRFQITMNMGSKAGATTHQVLADHRAPSLKAFLEECKREDFIEVEEVWRIDRDGQGRALREDQVRYESQGALGLNTFHIGKVKPYHPDQPSR